MSSMPVFPRSERTTLPPELRAISASWASPSGVSWVVRGFPVSSTRQATTRPSGPTSGIRSGVRPPICTT